MKGIIPLNTKEVHIINHQPGSVFGSANHLVDIMGTLTTPGRTIYMAHEGLHCCELSNLMRSTLNAQGKGIKETGTFRFLNVPIDMSDNEFSWKMDLCDQMVSTLKNHREVVVALPLRLCADLVYNVDRKYDGDTPMNIIAFAQVGRNAEPHRPSNLFPGCNIYTHDAIGVARDKKSGLTMFVPESVGGAIQIIRSDMYRFAG